MNIYDYLNNLHNKYPPFDFTNYVPVSWRGILESSDGTLYRITGVHHLTKNPIYDYAELSPNGKIKWNKGYYGRPWNYFNTMKSKG